MSIETLTSAILRQMPEINKWQRDFFLHLVGLFLSVRGRYNFLNLERYGQFNELTYRNHFQSGFDFKGFNQALILAHTGTDRMNVFDPSYISKSGKHTPGVGYFWSGCAGKAKWGLELSGFATVDVGQNTALHFFAAQTMPGEGQSLMDFYVQLLRENTVGLLKLSPYLGVDAFFSKKPFVGAACEAGLHVISRLRSDAVLHYAPPVPTPGQVGRPKKYGDRFSPKLPDAAQLPCVFQDEEYRVHAGKAWVKALARFVAIAVVHKLGGEGQVKSVKTYFCTDLDFPLQQVWTWYKSRFQIEFLYRDAKQFVGLDDCQSRQGEALNHHFNMALTAVSIAKTAHHLSIEKEKRGSFSMANIKTQYFNERFVDRVFQVFANSPNINKNHPDLQKLYEFGKIAA